MRQSPVYTPPGGPPPVQRPSPEIYEAMGEDGIARMLEDFYRRLAVSNVAHLFPSNEDALIAASRKSADFFVGLLGGPPLYHQRHGPPMLRARHIPFEIDEAARQEWLRCFRQTLEVAPKRFGFPREHVAAFDAWLDGFSTWMVNKAGGRSEK